jgi:ABC-type multidrug transport system ATPase subunit
MQIKLTNTGKRYNREWIFRHVDYEFSLRRSYAITGPNGSGKSTLLQVIAGAIQHSEGQVEYKIQDTGYKIQDTGYKIQDTGYKIQDTGYRIQDRHRDQVSGITYHVSGIDAYKNIAIATPYLELIEEMTASEFLSFHSTFKTFTKSIAEMLAELSLEKAANKQIRYFSSGMKQRLKLAQAFFSNNPVLLLDEPTTNLDADGIVLYHHLVNKYAREKLVIVSSNDKQEYSFCEEVISISNYK